MLTISFLALLALGQFAIGIVLFLESRRTKRTDQKLFSTLSFMFVIWTLAVGFLSNVDAAATRNNIEQYRVVNQIAFASTSLILLTLLTFVHYYPTKQRINTSVKAIFGLGILITSLSPLPFIAGSFSIVSGGLVYAYGGGIGLVVFYALAVLITIFINGRKRIKQAGNLKVQRQIRVLLLGVILTIAHILLLVVLVPALFGQVPFLYAVGYAGPYYLVLFTAYGLLQLGLFDIRRIVARTIGYLVTIVTLSAIYGFIVFGLLRLVFDPQLSFAVQAFLSLGTGVASLSFSGVKKYFDHKTTHIFYQDAYDSEELYDEYNKALVSTIDLAPLLKRTSSVIIKYLKSDFCLIAIQDDTLDSYRIVGTNDTRLNSHDIAVIQKASLRNRQVVIVTDDMNESQTLLERSLQERDVSIMVSLKTSLHANQDKREYIFLGPKKSGNPYTAQDVKVIETLSNELVIALQNALRFEEIERFSETLQVKVETATKQLRQSNRKLKKLNDNKDDFIGMASHQLRTPLTSAKGYISLVLDGDAGKINAAQRKLLEQAFVSSQRMVYLIADLLNVSRLKTGKFVIERVPTNLSKLITDEMAQLKAAAAARDITVTYHPPTRFPVLPLDETKTRQVIMNFLDNAIYYTPSGGHITIELRELPDSVEFEVIDDGIGVPAAERHHLFTKFYRAKNAQRARPDGTGLGLFMAQKVVVAQGGSIIFDSKEGVGSHFGFNFPKNMPLEPVELPAMTRRG